MDAVIDNTNPTREDRARYITLATAAGFRVIGFYFQSRISNALTLRGDQAMESGLNQVWRISADSFPDHRRLHQP